MLSVDSNDAESVNNIPASLTSKVPLTVLDAGVALFQWMGRVADYRVAFNAEFDKPLVEPLLTDNKPWLCAMKDFRWGYPSSNKHGSYSLIDLVLWMGVGVSTAHRAGDDVRLLVECMNRKKQELPSLVETAIARANSPIVELEALVDYHTKDLAKKAGFTWDDKPGHKGWFKQVKECDLGEFLGNLAKNGGFDIRQL